MAFSSGTMINENLEQLWRRIIFNILVSNTDDYLRNHGFILTSQGWILSPAYDINHSIDKSALALNIDMDNNALDFQVAKSVGEFFRLTEEQIDKILLVVLEVVGDWVELANEIGISKKEQQLIIKAFNV